MRKAPVAMMAAGAFLFYIICNQIWIYIYIMIFFYLYIYDILFMYVGFYMYIYSNKKSTFNIHIDLLYGRFNIKIFIYMIIYRFLFVL